MTEDKNEIKDYFKASPLDFSQENNVDEFFKESSEVVMRDAIPSGLLSRIKRDETLPEGQIDTLISMYKSEDKEMNTLGMELLNGVLKEYYEHNRS